MSFGLLTSLPLPAERRRNKERLEASLGGLCELELLKHRQESRVRGALRLGDLPARRAAPPDSRAADGGAARVPRSSLQCTPWGVMASLDQQVADMKVEAEVRLAGSSVSRLSSDEFVVKQDGSPEPSDNTTAPWPLSSPQETVNTETTETWLSDLVRQTTATEAREARNPSQENPLTHKAETYIFGLIQRRSLPPRPSKTRTSPAHDARGAAVARQSSVCHKDNKNNQVSVQEVSEPSLCSEARPNLHQNHRLGTETPEDALPPYQQLQHHKPRQANAVNTSLSHSVDYLPPRVLPTYSDSSDSDPDAPQHFQNYQPHFAVIQSPLVPSADEQLVSAEYIPAQPCRASSRAYAHYLSSSHKGSAVARASRGSYCSERTHHYQEQQPGTSHIQATRSRAGTKKCRLHEDKSGSSRKQGKKTCRSQSDNSLQRAPDRKYNTVERDGCGGRASRNTQARSKKQQEGGGGYHHCQSTVDLSQDEPDQPLAHTHISSALNQREHGARRTRKSHPAHTSSHAYTHHNLNHHFHHHEHVEYQLERNQGPPCLPAEDYRHHGQGESESSMSEADSPGSSSSSTDSDASGGLVWPQQLSPQLSLPSPPAPPGAHLQPKAFVKIKASHALKKKILRFRTGSLKVMTTV